MSFFEILGVGTSLEVFLERIATFHGRGREGTLVDFGVGDDDIVHHTDSDSDSDSGVVIRED